MLILLVLLFEMMLLYAWDIHWDKNHHISYVNCGACDGGDCHWVMKPIKIQSNKKKNI